MADSRLPSLDGLRAVAIALVLYDHAVLGAGLSTWQTFVGIGPRTFFVISGFLITTILLKEEERGRIRLARFHFRRALRIVPTVYAYLIVIGLLSVAGVLNVGVRELALGFSYATDVINPRSVYVGHTWSLSMQEQFYLLWPGLLALVGRRRALGVAVGIMVATPIVCVAIFHAFFPDYDLLGFVLDRSAVGNASALATGCALAILRPRLHGSTLYQRLLASPAWVLAGAFVILGPVLLADHPTIYWGVWQPISSVAIAFVIDHAVSQSRMALGRVMNLKPVVTIGTWSYSLYLWQQVFLMTPFHGIDGLLVRGGATMLTGWLSYRLVEQRSLLIRQRLEAKWFPRPALVLPGAGSSAAELGRQAGVQLPKRTVGLDA